MSSNKRPPASGRILVIDDEANILKTFRFCLEDAGYTVACARTAQDALQQLDQQVFDVCFLDLRLGDTSGLELLPELRTQAAWMKIVVVTAYSSIESAVEAIRLGAADY